MKINQTFNCIPKKSNHPLFHLSNHNALQAGSIHQHLEDDHERLMTTYVVVFYACQIIILQSVLPTSLGIYKQRRVTSCYTIYSLVVWPYIRSAHRISNTKVTLLVWQLNVHLQTRKRRWTGLHHASYSIYRIYWGVN